MPQISLESVATRRARYSIDIAIKAKKNGGGVWQPVGHRLGIIDHMLERGYLIDMGLIRQMRIDGALMLMAYYKLTRVGETLAAAKGILD